MGIERDWVLLELIDTKIENKYVKEVMKRSINEI